MLEKPIDLKEILQGVSNQEEAAERMKQLIDELDSVGRIEQSGNVTLDEQRVETILEIMSNLSMQTNLLSKPVLRGDII